MKQTVLLFTLVFVVAQCSVCQVDSVKDLKVVPSVDLQKYAGTWYEIARLPNSFQKKCAGDVTATYTLDEEGIEVVNRCVNDRGETIEARGRARLADKDGPNTKLEVRFAPAWLSWLPFVWGKYWIIDLAADYSYAVVGEPNRKYLWILSRAKTMDQPVLDGIFARLTSQGYNPHELVMTDQSIPMK